MVGEECHATDEKGRADSLDFFIRVAESAQCSNQPNEFFIISVISDLSALVTVESLEINTI